jgi:hypothetical protein
MRSTPSLPTLLGVLLVVLASGRVSAQPQSVAPLKPEYLEWQPILLNLLPLGAQVGSTVEVVVSGMYLQASDTLVFSDPGIEVERISTAIEPPQKPFVLRNMARLDSQLQMEADSQLRFKVTVPPGTPLGSHDARLLGSRGYTNARVFVVGDQAEIVEREPNDEASSPQRIAALDMTINGEIAAVNDVDYFAFTGQAGRRIVVSCRTSSVDSLLQPELKLVSADGKVLASNRYYFADEAVLDHILPADGDYFVRVAQFTTLRPQGNHHYRLSVGTSPWIDAVYPPVVEPGKPAQVTIFGRNLPGGKDELVTTIMPPDDPQARVKLTYSGLVRPASAGLDGFGYRLRNEAGFSNEVLIGLASGPVTLEAGDNDTCEKAQAVPASGEVVGRMEKLHDRDWFSFPAKKGQKLYIDVLGERIGSPVDLFITLHGPDGKQIGNENDSSGFLHALDHRYMNIATDDPIPMTFDPPADGTYSIMVSAREVGVVAGPRQIYRLKITTEASPDFRLVAQPDALMVPWGFYVKRTIYHYRPYAATIRAGGGTAFRVFAFRNDGFNDPIELRVEGLPNGLTCPPQILAPGRSEGLVVIQAKTDAEPWAGTIRIIGTAAGQIKQEARPAGIVKENSTQQYHRAQNLVRLERELVLAVRGSAPFQVIPAVSEVNAKVGEKVNIPVNLNRMDWNIEEPVRVTLMLNHVTGSNYALTEDYSFPFIYIEADTNLGDNGIIELDTSKIKPGTYTVALKGTVKLQPPQKPSPHMILREFSSPITLKVESKSAPPKTQSPE